MTQATKIRIPDLREHAAYKAASERLSKLNREQASVIKEGAEYHATGHPIPDGLLRRARACDSLAVMGADADLKIATADASSEARAKIEASTEYKRLILAALEADMTRLKAVVDLESTNREAGRAGIALLPLRAVAAADLADLILWAKQAMRQGIVTMDDLPAPLVALIGGK